jgi:hypothetical protein
VAEFNPFLEQLHRVFGGGVERNVAVGLLDYLSRNPGTTHITLQLVRQIAGMKQDDDRAIVRTLQYLAGDGVGLLVTRFEYVDEDDSPHDLTDEEVEAVVKYGVNPITGDSDASVRGRITVYFSPTDEATRVVGQGDARPERGQN